MENTYKNTIVISDFSYINRLAILLSLDERFYMPIKHNAMSFKLLVQEIIQKNPNPNDPSIMSIKGTLEILGEITPCIAELDFKNQTGKIHY